jgi:quinol monooxygenase YgiN
MSTIQEIDTIGRFHAKEGCEEELAQAIREAWAPAEAEEGCVFCTWYRSIKNPRLFFVHSRWRSNEAFDIHADLPHTVALIEKAEKLIDHPLDVTRLLELDR